MNTAKKSFDATFDINLARVDEGSGEYPANIQESLVRVLNAHCFAILNAGSSKERLLGLKRLFGDAAPHPRADEEGIVPITNSVFTPGYLGSTSLAHRLHTDGAFLDFPERICSLQCVQNASSGGDTLLVSAKKAFETVRKLLPTCYLGLLRADALKIERNHQHSTQPVYKLIDGRLTIKFRQNDGMATITRHPYAAESIEELTRFIENSKYQLKLRLTPGEILVVDNGAILHGRTAFSATEIRNMRRLNFIGNGPLMSALQLGFETEPQA